MARSRRYHPLNVYLNSRLVGQLRRESSGAIEFQYDDGWLAWPHTLPVSLSLPLREESYTGAPVLAVFENLLPTHYDPSLGLVMSGNVGAVASPKRGADIAARVADGHV